MSAPQKYRKKPVEIEAWEYTGFAEGDSGWDILHWIDAAGEQAGGHGQGPAAELRIETLEGVMAARIGDFIIRGVKGEFYPCKDSIFRETYEAVSGDEPSTPVEINTPAVRQAISVAVHDEMAEEAAGLAPMVAGRVFVILDRASAGLPFDAAVVSE